MTKAFSEYSFLNYLLPISHFKCQPHFNSISQQRARIEDLKLLRNKARVARGETGNDRDGLKFDEMSSDWFSV